MVDATDRIAGIIAPSLEGMGYELVRVHLTGGQRPTLQVMAERADQGAMTVEDCADISRAVAAVLDVEDPLPDAYVLEVSSPGIDAPLTRLKDFARNVGMAARVETAELVEGRKRFVGRILGVETGDAGDLIRMSLEKDAGKASKTKSTKGQQRKRKSALSSLADPVPAKAGEVETMQETAEEEQGQGPAEALIPFPLIQRAKLLLTDELLKRAAAQAGASRTATGPGTQGGEMQVEGRPRRSKKAEAGGPEA